MIALWMLYALMLSTLLTVAAWGAERALRLHGRPARWIWAATLAASLIVPVTMLARPAVPEAETMSSSDEAASTGPSMTLPELATVRLAPSPALESASPHLIAAWALLALGALGFLGVGVLHLSGQRRVWPIERVRGCTVRVAEAFGPAVVGVLRPEIVLPRWMLDMDAVALDLALRHEREHMERRDTLLLAAGFVAAAAAPWNIALWAQLRRMRLAVELDCDLRVLASGASRRDYGALLLQVGGHAGRGRLAVAALSEPTSFLERRLRMITRPSNERKTIRTVGALALTGVVVALACDVPTPTEVAPPPASAQMAAVQSRAASDTTIRVRDAGAIEAAAPVFFVDDIRIVGDAQAFMSTLEPNDILRIEVIKGAAAIRQHPDAPEAANGIIRIYMKPGRGGVLTPGA